MFQKLKNDTEIQLLPLIYSCKMGKVSANTEVTVSEMIGIWCHIEADTQDGWVMKSKLEGSETEKEEATDNKEEKEEKEEKTNKTETAGTKLYVKTTTLNLREKAESGSKILTQLDYGDELTVVEVVDSTWTKVKSGSYTGYIATKYASKEKPEDVTSRNAYEPRTSNTEKEKEDTKTTETASTKKTETNKTTTKTETSNKESSKKETTSSSDKKSSSKVTGSDVVEYAKKFLGCKYVYGAAGPNTFDCSGFTSYVYKHFGYSLNRTSSGQRNNGKAVSKKDLQPGDIVCFSGHVGIYVGNNQFIHAPRTGDVVKYTSLSNSYYVKNYITARRIIY